MGVGEVFRNSAGLLRNKKPPAVVKTEVFMDSVVKHIAIMCTYLQQAESPKQLLARKVSQEQGKHSGNFHAVLPPHKGAWEERRPQLKC